MNTDEELMIAHTAGDPQAFRKLFDRYASLLFRLMRRGLARESDAQDLVQQTFLQLHRARYDYRPDSLLRPWLMTIALNLKREFLRRGQRRPENLTADFATEFSDHPAEAAKDPVEQGQLATVVRDALTLLPENQREIIELHWFDEMSFPEISQLLGVSLSAVKVRAHRGYKVLKEHLAGHASQSFPQRSQP